MRKVALDVGVRKTAYCEVQNGAVIDRGTVSSVAALQWTLGPDRPPAEVAIEACRQAWFIYDKLTEWNNKVLLVDTTRAKRIGVGQHGRKTDRLDAEVLALALERGGIPLAHVLSPARRELRRQLGVRRSLVQSRAEFVVTARGIALEFGERLPGCEVESFSKHARSRPFAKALEVSLAPLLTTIDVVSEQIIVVEEELTRLYRSEPVIALLCTVPGVGALVAGSFVSVVDDAKRFRDAHSVESYLGLVPSEHSSGGSRQRLGAITKQGNCYARAMLVQAAWSLMTRGPLDDPMRRWAQAVAERRGKRIAVIALARRLVGVLWALWRDNTAYDPALAGRASVRGLRCQAQSLDERTKILERALRKRSAAKLGEVPPKKSALVSRKRRAGKPEEVTSKS